MAANVVCAASKNRTTAYFRVLQFFRVIFRAIFSRANENYPKHTHINKKGGPFCRNVATNLTQVHIKKNRKWFNQIGISSLDLTIAGCCVFQLYFLYALF